MLCVMMLPLVVVSCTSKQSVSQCVKPPPPAWIMQPPRLAQTPLDGIVATQRLIIIKQLEGTQSILMVVQIELPIIRQLMQLL